MLVEFALFFAGLLLLYFGAEFLVAGSSALALTFGVKPLVVGLTVVAFGTSSPELLVCLTAAIEHTAATDAISIGNIIGSNIANIALILGCASLIRPIKVTEQAVKREYPLMLAASVLLVLLIVFDSPDQTLSRLDGGLLVTGMAGYLLYSYFTAIFADDDEADAGPSGEQVSELEEIEEPAPEEESTPKQAGKILLGIVGLAVGAYLMVESAVAIAHTFDVPELVIGISIVALGTSLPELATSIIAAVRDESDISVGNVIGSNLFNILLVLGTVSLIAPISVKERVLDFDLWMMMGVSIGIWPILRSGRQISRGEGIGMLVIYTGYIIMLFLR